MAGGWNKPTGKPVEVKKAAKPALKHGLIAGGVVAVLGCILLAVFSGGGEKPKAKAEKKAGVIKEVKPAAAPKAEAKEEPQFRINKHGKKIKIGPPNVYTDECGIARYEGGARVFNPDDVKRAVPLTHNGCLPVFNNNVDLEIATLITLQPGQMLFGTPKYGKGMEKEFMNALLNPIEIKEDDSEWDKEIKRAVEETKHDIAQRIKNGEDLNTILREAREDLQRSAQYKREIQEVVGETLNNPDASDADVEIAFEAANKMLEAKGIAPIKAKAFIVRRQRLMGTFERKEVEK